MRTRRALLVVPANNTTMQPEVAALCPEIGTLDVARVPRPPRTLTREDVPAYAEATLAAVEPFASEAFDLVVYGCTAAGFLSGPEGNARIAEALGRRLRAPVVSTAGAMVEVLREEGAGRISVVTPYLPEVNEGLTAYLAASGITVRALSSFLCTTVSALAEVTEDEVIERALATAAPSGVDADDALFVACSQLPTLRAVRELCDRLGIPVWSSIAATAWAATRTLAASGQRSRWPEAALPT